MNNKLPIIISLLVILLAVEFCFAQGEPENLSNLRILYQGQLTDSGGNPLVDGRYNIRFVIYDEETQGNILWQEEYTFYNAISVGGGQFKVILGRVNPINLNLDKAPFWLGITLGTLAEENQVKWGEEIQPRKKITTLSELLGVEELTPEQWENLSQLIKEKLGDETDIVLLFDITQLESLGTGEGIDFSSSIISFFQNFINFISEKISEIGEKLNQILAKIDSIISTLTNIVNTLAELKHKIDVLYEVLIVQQGLEPSGLVCAPNHLNPCLNETDCTYAGGFWYGGICNAGAEPGAPTCDVEHLNSCTTQEICEGAGLHWYNDICNPEPRAPEAIDTDEDGIPDSQDACPNVSGDYCHGCPKPECNGCQSPVCPETDPPSCKSQGDCPANDNGGGS